MLVPKSNRGKHVGFADFSGANFDHVHAVLVAGKHQVQIAEIKLSDGWIDDKLRAGFGLQTTHAHGCDWTLKWCVGDGQRGACGGACDHVGIALAVVAEHDGLQLNFINETIWKERPNWPIHHSHCEHFLLRRSAFFLAETAWKSAYR